MTRILVFSPYACRPHLTAYEGTIARACQIRGAAIEYVLCDGLLAECDMHWDSFPAHFARPLNLCQHCQVGAKNRMAEIVLPYKWLGEFVSQAERKHAFAWAQSLSPSEMYRACFMDYPIGDWVVSSVSSFFRQYPPDMDNWHVVNVYRGFLFSASIVAIGLRNYLEAYSIDSALLFNGRQSLTRVAFEILRWFGIRVLTHEWPFYQPGHLNLKPNATCWSPRPFAEYWRMWGRVPLTRPSLERIFNWLVHRRYGKNLTWYPFNTPFTPDLSLRKKLNLSQNKRLLALFTSSTDETAGDPELQGPYESQSSWVQDVVNWVRDRKDLELVIRVHPHLSGNTGLGRAVDEFSFYQEMKSALPANIRLVLPDDSLNSYALTDEADIGLTFGSTIGIEMAMLGKPVVLGARGFYENGSNILTIRSKQSMPEILEKSLRSFSPREIRREAFRLAYYYVFEFELPFPLVSMLGVMNLKLNYSSPEALAPGQDDSLDRICNFLTEGRPLYDSPTEAELARTTAEEDTFFAEMEQSPEPMRDVDYERWLQRKNLANWLGRSIQNTLQRLPLGAGNVLNKVGKIIYLPFLHWVEKKA